MAWCSLHDGEVPEHLVISLHGGRGREPRVTCIPCILNSVKAWAETGCPFCVATADRMVMAIETMAIETYLETRCPFTLPEVPTEELPAHKADCPWVDDVLPGQAR